MVPKGFQFTIPLGFKDGTPFEGPGIGVCFFLFFPNLVIWRKNSPSWLRWIARVPGWGEPFLGNREPEEGLGASDLELLYPSGCLKHILGVESSYVIYIYMYIYIYIMELQGEVGPFHQGFGSFRYGSNSSHDKTLRCEDETGVLISDRSMIFDT